MPNARAVQRAETRTAADLAARLAVCTTDEQRATVARRADQDAAHNARFAAPPAAPPTASAPAPTPARLSQIERNAAD